MLSNPSRRRMLSAPVGLLWAATRWRPAAAQALSSQQAAGYQAQPKGLQMCGTCTLFIEPDRGKTVAGPVERRGWCKLYDPVD